MKKLVLLVGIAGLVIGFLYFDINQFLTLEGFKASLGHFENWRTTSPLLVGGSFFLLYVMFAALSLPGAVVMTLAAGAMFGMFWGLSLSSFLVDHAEALNLSAAKIKELQIGAIEITFLDYNWQLNEKR